MTLVKQTIEDLYILELDKNPINQTFNPVKGNVNAANSNLTFAVPGHIQFITNDPAALLLNNLNKPAIFETEPKQKADLKKHVDKIDGSTAEKKSHRMAMMSRMARGMSIKKAHDDIENKKIVKI